MRFQQLVFRTTPHSLVEWLDGELEKRGIDCVYTHCILSILQEDRDDIEPDDCIKVKNNQQKVYHKYGGPESLFSATKSKHQKWKTYGKQILLTSSISSSDSNITDLEKRNKIAAINCLKSVSDDNAIEDLIEEVCLKLKNIRNMNALNKSDSMKSMNIVDKDTAFFIPPSSPTDQVEKYFADFPPLGRKVEDKIDSCQAAHLNAWMKENRNIDQENSHNSFQNSEISKFKQDNSYGSLKSIENIYQGENNSKIVNRLKISSSSKHDKNAKFSDENGYSQHSVKNVSKVDFNLPSLSKSSEKLRNYKANKATIEVHKSNLDSRKKSTFSSDYKKVKNLGVISSPSNKLPIIVGEKSSKIPTLKTPSAKDVTIGDVSENITAPEVHTSIDVMPTENVNEAIEQTKVLYGKKSLFDLAGKNTEYKDSKMDKITSNRKNSFKKETLKSLKKIKKRKTKTSKVKIGIAHPTSENIHSKILSSEWEVSHSYMKKENPCDKKISDTVNKKTEAVASDMQLSTLESFQYEDENYKEGEIATILFMKRYEFNSAISAVEINCAGSKVLLICDNIKRYPVSIRNASINLNSYAEFRSDNICEILQLPFYDKQIFHQNFTLPFENLNLIFGTNVYYNFNLDRAFDFFSPREIFNILTVGDVNEVSCFLRNFSGQSDSRFYNLDSGTLSDDEKDGVVKDQDTKCIKFHCITSANYSGSSPMILSNLHLKIDNDKFSFSSDGHQLLDFDNINSGRVNFCLESPQFESQNSQEELIKDDTSTASGNWNYSVFFDLNKENASYLGNSDVPPPFLNNDSYDFGKLNGLSSKYNFKENNCKIDSLEEFYNAKNEIIYEEVEVPYTNYDEPDDVFYSEYNFKEKCLIPEIESEDECLKFLEPNKVNLNDMPTGSAFKPIQKIDQQCLIQNSTRSEQNLLKKVTNIDRIIQRIDAKSRVIAFQNLQDVSFALPCDVREEIISPPSRSSLSSSFNAYNNETDCNILRDSYFDKRNLSLNDEYADSLLGFSAKILRSAWDEKICNVKYIWKNGSKVVKLEEKNSRVSADSCNFDEEFKDDDELLKDIYTMLDSDDERNLHSDVQPVSNQIYDVPYALNINPANESLPTNFEKIAGSSSSMHDMSVQAVNISGSNTFDFPLPVPHDDPVSIFSLDNCKQSPVDSLITCSENAYQDSDFIDVSAFRGPYGSYTENQTNYIEGGGWSLDSDNYLLESEAFYDQSSSMYELSTAGSESESFKFLPLDGQRLPTEDNELMRINATQRFSSGMRRRIRHKCPTFRRPCAFYMEGSCNRSDCRFSHDLSNITCRFWQEDSCFKGSTCPFLHGYIADHKIADHPVSKEEERKYSLDSDADFPPLSNAKSEKIPVSKSEPLDIVHVKGQNSKTNH